MVMHYIIMYMHEAVVDDVMSKTCNVHIFRDIMDMMVGSIKEGRAEDVKLADAGFLEGITMRVKRAKFSKPHPLLLKTTPIFDRFGEKLLAPPCQSSRFRSRFF